MDKNDEIKELLKNWTIAEAAFNKACEYSSIEYTLTTTNDDEPLTGAEESELLDMLAIPTFDRDDYPSYPEECITKREDNVVYVDFK